MSKLVTLTTDFAESDPYVATVKGILYSRCPGVTVVDMTHDVGRKNVFEAALFIAGAAPSFPDGTVHLIAVASGADPIAVSLGNQFAVCPDNGVLTLLADQLPVKEVRAITNPKFDLSQGYGQIYFAQDIFAPAAAHVAHEGSIQEVGARLDNLKRMGLPRAVRESDKVVQGQVMHVNRFGSLVTNIHRSLLEGCTVTRVTVGDFRVGPLSRFYTDVENGVPLALYGNAGYIEIACNGNRADKLLNFGQGIRVIVDVKAAS